MRGEQRGRWGGGSSGGHHVGEGDREEGSVGAAGADGRRGESGDGEPVSWGRRRWEHGTREEQAAALGREAVALGRGSDGGEGVKGREGMRGFDPA